MRFNSRTGALFLLLAAVSATAFALLPDDGEALADSGTAAAAQTQKASEEKPLRLAILLFEGVQIIDYTGPWEVFGHASVHNHPAFEIYSVAETAGPLTTAMGMSVNPKYTFANAPKPDVILLPGGNVQPQLGNTAVLAWIGDAARDARVVFSVCNGAFFLAKAGLLDGLEATTFAALIPQLREAAPKTRVVSDRRFVDNGKVVTAAGLSSGIDGALHVIEKLFGRGQAEVVATGLEYHWQPDSRWARATLADIQLNPVYGWVRQFADRSVIRHSGTPEQWETEWKFTTDKSASQILRDLEPVVGKEKWSPEGSAKESGRSWKFSDRDGRAWKAAATVAPVAGDPKGRLLTVKVSRAS